MEADGELPALGPRLSPEAPASSVIAKKREAERLSGLKPRGRGTIASS